MVIFPLYTNHKLGHRPYVNVALVIANVAIFILTMKQVAMINQLGRLDFAAADPQRFPALRLARRVLELGGLAGAVFNAAKEAALDAYLLGSVGFLDMAVLVEHVLEDLGPEAAAQGPGYDLEAVMALDAAARRMAGVWVEAFGGR